MMYFTTKQKYVKMFELQVEALSNRLLDQTESMRMNKHKVQAKCDA